MKYFPSAQSTRDFEVLCYDCLKYYAVDYPEAKEVLKSAPNGNQESIRTCWGKKCYDRNKMGMTVIPAIIVEEDFEARREIHEEEVFELDEEYRPETQAQAYQVNQSRRDSLKSVDARNTATSFGRERERTYETRTTSAYEYEWYSGDLYMKIDEDLLMRVAEC